MKDVDDLFAAGRAAYERDDLIEAEAAFREAIASEPRPAFRAALAMVLLKQGQLNEGFFLHEAWRQLRPTPQLPLPRWRGEDLAGKKLLIISEDGFGDQILFSRFALRARDRAQQVTWICSPPLVSLFRANGIEAVSAEAPHDISADVYSPSGGLAGCFDLSQGPLPAPYLAVHPRPTTARIGVMTEFNRSNVSAANRQLPLHLVSALHSIPASTDLSPTATGAADFLETAEIVAGLDAVISIDTAVANLAGALGKPVFVLSQRPYGDWRWGSGQVTPWYPSANVYRQSLDGSWDAAVLAAIHGAAELMRSQPTQP